MQQYTVAKDDNWNLPCCTWVETKFEVPSVESLPHVEDVVLTKLDLLKVYKFEETANQDGAIEKREDMENCKFETCLAIPNLHSVIKKFHGKGHFLASQDEVRYLNLFALRNDAQIEVQEDAIKHCVACHQYADMFVQEIQKEGHYSIGSIKYLSKAVYNHAAQVLCDMVISHSCENCTTDYDNAKLDLLFHVLKCGKYYHVNYGAVLFDVSRTLLSDFVSRLLDNNLFNLLIFSEHAECLRSVLDMVYKWCLKNATRNPTQSLHYLYSLGQLPPAYRSYFTEVVETILQCMKICRPQGYFTYLDIVCRFCLSCKLNPDTMRRVSRSFLDVTVMSPSMRNIDTASAERLLEGIASVTNSPYLAKHSARIAEIMKQSTSMISTLKHESTKTLFQITLGSVSSLNRLWTIIDATRSNKKVTKLVSPLILDSISRILLSRQDSHALAANLRYYASVLGKCAPYVKYASASIIEKNLKPLVPLLFSLINWCITFQHTNDANTATMEQVIDFLAALTSANAQHMVQLEIIKPIQCRLNLFLSKIAKEHYAYRNSALSSLLIHTNIPNKQQIQCPHFELLCATLSWQENPNFPAQVICGSLSFACFVCVAPDANFSKLIVLRDSPEYSKVNCSLHFLSTHLKRAVVCRAFSIICQCVAASNLASKCDLFKNQFVPLVSKYSNFTNAYDASLVINAVEYAKRCLDPALFLQAMDCKLLQRCNKWKKLCSVFANRVLAYADLHIEFQ